MADSAALMAVLNDYATQCFTVKIVNYIGGQNGGNIDVGEEHGYNLDIENKGDLGMRDVRLAVTASDYGQVTGEFWGWSNIAGGHWHTWSKSWITPPFDVFPGQKYRKEHASSGGKLFGFKATSSTGAGPNYRQEDLFTVRLVSWMVDPRFSPLALKPVDLDTFNDFIQRN